MLAKGRWPLSSSTRVLCNHTFDPHDQGSEQRGATRAIHACMHARYRRKDKQENRKRGASWHRSAGAHTRRACHCVISARATQPQKDRRREVDSTHPLTLTESILTKSMGRTVGTDTSNMMPLNVWSSLSPVSCVVCSCTTWLTCKTRMQRSVHKYV
jgi:hypothetical protein